MSFSQVVLGLVIAEVLAGYAPLGKTLQHGRSWWWSRPARIPANAAKRMKELLQSVQAPVAGFVLNDRPALYSDTYGYYGKGYYGRRYYAYYGVDDQKDKHRKKSWWENG